MIRKLLLASLLILFVYNTQSFGAWYNVAWASRFAVTITNLETRALVYYQVGVTFTGSSYTALHGCAKSDYSDLRVTSSDGVTLLTFWLEDTSITSSVALLVKVPSIPASSTATIYVYCGNAAATSISSANSTITSANVAPRDATPSVTIDNTASVFNGPGMIGQAINGNLVIVYASGGDSNFGENASFYYSTSADNGATWAARSLLVAGAAGFDKPIRSTKLTRLANNNLVGWVQSDTHANIDVSFTGNSYYIQSTDNGATWSISAAKATPAGFSTASPYGHITELANGDLIDPWQGIPSGGDTRYSGFLMTCVSGNNCLLPASWTLFGGSAGASLFMRDASQAKDFDEADVVVINSNTWLAVGRYDFTNATLYTTKTTNAGSTWSAPSTITDVTGVIPLAAVSVQLILLADGNVLLTYGERNVAAAGTGMASAISTDAGVTWTQFALPAIVNNSASKDGAYSSTIQLASGLLYTAVPYASEADGNFPATAPLYGFTWDEDWAANPYGDYRDISTTVAFTLGANAARNTSIGHSGTDSIKFDNNAGTQAYAWYLLGATSDGYPKRVTALNFWWRIDNNDFDFAAMKDNNSAIGATNARILTSVQDFASNGAPFDDKWYDGAAYQNWTTPQTGTIATTVWNKNQLRGKTTSTSAITGGLSFNDILAGNNATNGDNGTGNLLKYGYWQAGSTASTNNDIFYIDDVYTSQWSATVPTFSVGAIENLATPPCRSHAILIGVSNGC